MNGQKPCPSGKEQHPFKSTKCLKKCRDDQYRNKNTMRCKKHTSSSSQPKNQIVNPVTWLEHRRQDNNWPQHENIDKRNRLPADINLQLGEHGQIHVVPPPMFEEEKSHTGKYTGIRKPTYIYHSRKDAIIQRAVRGSKYFHGQNGTIHTLHKT